jgi:hypothetical protein
LHQVGKCGTGTKNSGTFGLEDSANEFRWVFVVVEAGCETYGVAAESGAFRSLKNVTEIRTLLKDRDKGKPDAIDNWIADKAVRLLLVYSRKGGQRRPKGGKRITLKRVQGALCRLAKDIDASGPLSEFRRQLVAGIGVTPQAFHTRLVDLGLVVPKKPCKGVQ